MIRKLGALDALAIVAAVIITTGAVVLRVKYGDPEAVWFFCDILGLCASGK